MLIRLHKHSTELLQHGKKHNNMLINISTNNMCNYTFIR